MRLNEEQQKILDGKKGRILQSAMMDLVKYGTAVGAEEFVPITSAHNAFQFMGRVARCFPPRGRLLTEKDIDKFSEEIAVARVKVKTTVNPAIMDLRKWRQMGADKSIYDSVMRTVEIARKCGIMANYNCIPYLTDNIPLMGDHISWAETSACLYANSFLGARSNRDSVEISLFSALLGITPNFGMHLDENRKGTDLIDVQCELENTSDWGALGHFTGERVGVGIPVFIDLRRPSVEEAVQLAAATNSSGGGGVPLLFIPGVSPEAPTVEAAFNGDKPRKTYVFDEAAKRAIYQKLNCNPEGKVDMVNLGCPHLTLHEIKELSRMLEGKRVAKGTKLWLQTTSSFRALAEQLGYAQIIEATGAKLFADACLYNWYVNTPVKRTKMNRVATDSVKNAFGARRSFHSNIFFGNTERCIDIAIKGGV